MSDLATSILAILNDAWGSTREADIRRLVEVHLAHHEEGVEAWIEREYLGYGRAIRKKDETPFPDEPYMSMDDAKELTRRAVAEFSSPSPASGEADDDSYDRGWKAGYEAAATSRPSPG